MAPFVAPGVNDRDRLVLEPDTLVKVTLVGALGAGAVNVTAEELALAPFPRFVLAVYTLAI